jgi:outer membrane lipoprotein-sorting protein
MGSALKRNAVLLPILCLLVPLGAAAQSSDMVSAEKFFSNLSASFGAVKDYEAALSITQGKTVSRGRISYKSPMYLFIRFDDPANEVICFDGEKLTVYLPGEQVVLQQTYKKKTPSQIEGLVTAQGLGLLQKNYSIAYLTGPSPVPLDDGSKEMAVKLRLVSRGTSSFSQLVISVEGSVFRRVEGMLANGDKVVMDFTGMRTNQGVPASRFAYDPPPYANVIQDWLFDPEQ